MRMVSGPTRPSSLITTSGGSAGARASTRYRSLSSHDCAILHGVLQFRSSITVQPDAYCAIRLASIRSTSSEQGWISGCMTSVMKPESFTTEDTERSLSNLDLCVLRVLRGAFFGARSLWLLEQHGKASSKSAW